MSSEEHSRDSEDAKPLVTLLGQSVLQSTWKPSPVLEEIIGPISPLDSPDDLFSQSHADSAPLVPSKLPPVLDDVPSAAINNMRNSSSSPSPEPPAKSTSSKSKPSTPSKGQRKKGHK